MTPISYFTSSLDLAEEVSVLEKTKDLTLVNLGNIMAKSFLIKSLLEKTGLSDVFWASTDEKAEALKVNLDLFFDESQIVLIPEEITFAKYYEILRLSAEKTQHIFLFEDFEKVSQTSLPDYNEILAEAVNVQEKDELKIYDFFESLEQIGYKSAEDELLNPGEFLKKGDVLFVYPLNEAEVVQIELFGDEVEKISIVDQLKLAKNPKTRAKKIKQITIFPKKFKKSVFSGNLASLLAEDSLFISDDLDETICLNNSAKNFYKIRFTSFPKENEQFFHLNFFSVLPFYTIPDFVTDVKERFRRGFQIIVMTKKWAEIRQIFTENNIMFTENVEEKFASTVNVIKIGKEDFLPHSFQNNDQKIVILTDREIFQFRRNSRQKKAISGMNFELMNSLKNGNFVVHIDHGIAKYEGIIQRELNKGEIREYLKLSYLKNDKLFVPVDSAEKVSKYIGDEEPKLTTLGGNEWQKVQSKLKKEAEKIAKDLLKLYANRELSKGKIFTGNSDMMNSFCASFPYEMTPGQAQAWDDVRIDMERQKPMDRLVCGDVGFGKTEIAMRAAFKAFCSGYQAAILAPITILAEQHYQGFLKRIAEKEYGIRIELLSRFQTGAEQKKILKDLEFGLVDIVIGTHRLLSEDIKFKKLGIIIVDEEQRFGVKQKEKLKKMKTGVDILTLTATPIPRTLHMGLNKLKDVSTITTPPPGRLPVVTEVRKYGLDLIREKILSEIERGGQVYFLHNQVQTIESQAQQLQSLMPNVRFIVAHGQMNVYELEARIRKFKNKEADVLIASTIIENGIDLPNANTLFVNRAEKFGLAQLYQLRGRVGRGRTQAYAYFLYQGQRLKVDAKKRLRAIVEASELGAGFQIAMRDLEIRGAGEILGANQSGAMKDTGVGHFIRMLNQTVKKIQAGEITAEESHEEENITVEVPLTAFIPPNYIPNTEEKIRVYQEISGIPDLKTLETYKKDLISDFGHIPKQVENLCKIIQLKIILRSINLTGIRLQKLINNKYELVLKLGTKFKPEQIFRLLKESPKKWVISANSIKLVMKSLSFEWYLELLNDLKLLKLEEKKIIKK